MTDIFVSYGHEDAAVAEALAVALTARGWSVWIDRVGLSEGALFDEQIEAAIASAAVVMVLWSAASVQSRWVRAEAAFALDNGSLVPVAIDTTLPPLQFLHVQNVSMVGWDGAADSPQALALYKTLERRLQSVPTAPALTAPRETDEAVSREGMGAWRRLMISLGLRFPGAYQESLFLQKLGPQVYAATQGCLVAGIAVMAAYGATDLVAGVNTALMTRIRFMVVIPALTLLYLFSRTRWAREKWAITTPVFILAAEAAGLVMIYFIATRTAFGGNIAVPSMNVMIVFGIVALIPVQALATLTTTAPVLAAYLIYVSTAPQATSTIAVANAINPVVAFCLCIAVAFVRERTLRRSFVADLALSDSVATLREALLRLGSQERKAEGRPKRRPGGARKSATRRA
jgi:hypothetical protein